MDSESMGSFNEFKNMEKTHLANALEFSYESFSKACDNSTKRVSSFSRKVCPSEVFVGS